MHYCIVIHVLRQGHITSCHLQGLIFRSTGGGRCRPVTPDLRWLPTDSTDCMVALGMIQLVGPQHASTSVGGQTYFISRLQIVSLVALASFRDWMSKAWMSERITAFKGRKHLLPRISSHGLNRNCLSEICLRYTQCSNMCSRETSELQYTVFALQSHETQQRPKARGKSRERSFPTISTIAAR